MTAIIMRKGVWHSVAYTVQQALELNESGYVIVAYIKWNGVITQKQLAEVA